MRKIATVDIVIETDGTSQIAVKGHAGSGCTDLTAAIEKALGETTKDERTSEYNLRAQATQAQTQRR